jgi:DNA (cytosine-5)-methyltransferase 1
MEPVVRHLDLFSGIGGFALACRMVGGIETVAFCEREPYCQKVLAKHWPTVPICNDIHDLKGTEYGTVELITGGFPCQPFSIAGKRSGKEDDRFLWPQYLRIIETTRPRWVLGENVAGIVGMELDQVLSDLDGAGYSARAHIIPAVGVDAPHRRDRVWIVAHSKCDGQQDGRAKGDAGVAGFGKNGKASENICPAPTESGGFFGRNRWPVEPTVGRVVNGLSTKLDRDRLKALGNAIVPQVAAEIIRAMMQADRQANPAVLDRAAKGDRDE